MDAGLAAVLGALAGAVATTGAAFATGWSAREQAKMAARAEHRRQRRDARQAVYEEFINSVETLIEKTSMVHIDLREVHDGLRPDEQEATSLSDSIRKLSTKVMLAGPASISERVPGISSDASSLAGFLSMMKVYERANESELLSESWTQAREYRSKLYNKITAFSRDAQAVLDDDGTLS